MARLDRIPEPMHSHLANLPCPSFKETAWVSGKPLSLQRISLISTAGLHQREDKPFQGMSGDYRVIPRDIMARDLVMSHISTNFDRTGFLRDWNVMFPLDRLREFADENIIGSVAAYHYSFMGATDPSEMESSARNLAVLLNGDQVDAVLLAPV